MKKRFVAFVVSWSCASSVLCASPAWADAGPVAGLYVTNQECAATPDKGPCAALGTICVTSAGGRTIGTVARRSLAYVENDIVAGVRFDVSSSSLSGTYTAAFPTRGTRCKQDHEYPATASFGSIPSGGAFVELMVPAYKQLDLATCALGASPREFKVRYFQTTDGTTCGSQAASSPAHLRTVQPLPRARARKRPWRSPAQSGSLEVLVDIVEGAQGTFYGFALTDRRRGSRTIVPERTLKLAQQELDARAEPDPAQLEVRGRQDIPPGRRGIRDGGLPGPANDHEPGADRLVPREDRTRLHGQEMQRVQGVRTKAEDSDQRRNPRLTRRRGTNVAREVCQRHLKPNTRAPFALENRPVMSARTRSSA